MIIVYIPLKLLRRRREDKIFVCGNGCVVLTLFIFSNIRSFHIPGLIPVADMYSIIFS